MTISAGRICRIKLKVWLSAINVASNRNNENTIQYSIQSANAIIEEILNGINQYQYLKKRKTVTNGYRREMAGVASNQVKLLYISMSVMADTALKLCLGVMANGVMKAIMAYQRLICISVIMSAIQWQ
jgi:hypothetical protein